MNYEEMSDFEINCLVAVAVEPTLNYGFSYEKESGAANFRLCDPIGDDHDAGTYNFCNNPSDAWPIIVENRITITPYGDSTEGWFATYDTSFFIDDDNPLKAAMIVFLMMQEPE